MSSDSTGEIYVLVKTTNSTGTPTSTSTASPSPSSTKKSDAALMWEASSSAWWVAVLGIFVLL